MTLRINPADITPTASTPFMTPWAARVAQPLADLLKSEELFLNVRGMLRAGDKVELARFEHGDWRRARVIEFVTVLITQATPTAVEFRQLTDILDIEAADPALEPAKETPVLPELEMVPNDGGGFLVREVVSGHVHKHFKNEAAAKRYMTDYGGKPKAEAA